MSCSWLITWYEQSIPYKNMVQFLLNEGLKIDVVGRELCKSNRVHFHAVVSGQKRGGAQALRKGLRTYRKFLQLPTTWWDNRKGIQISMIHNYGNCIQYCKKDGNYKENVATTEEIAKNGVSNVSAAVCDDRPERLHEGGAEYNLTIPLDSKPVSVEKSKTKVYDEFVGGGKKYRKNEKLKK